MRLAIELDVLGDTRPLWRDWLAARGARAGGSDSSRGGEVTVVRSRDELIAPR